MDKKLQLLVIHCSATPEGRNVMPSDIARIHLEEKGWKQIGYSKFVLLDGTIHHFIKEDNDEFVDPWEVTNGVKGINSISRHICYAGGMDKANKVAKDTRTYNQKIALGKIVKDMVKKYPGIKVAGHYHFAAKACPSFNVERFCEEIGVPESNIYRKGSR